MKKLFAAMPLLTTVAGSLLIGYLAVKFFMTLSLALLAIGLGSLLIYCYWLAWESRISVNELSKRYVHNDYHTMELAAVAKTTTLATAFIGGTEIHPFLAIPGILLMIYGIRLRQYAVIALGNQYSHRLRVPVNICEEGPYNFLRHPAYLGTFLAHVGLVMVFFNKWSVLSVLLLWGSVVLIRTVVEDRMLMKIPEYQKYAQRVRFKLLSGIW